MLWSYGESTTYTLSPLVTALPNNRPDSLVGQWLGIPQTKVTLTGSNTTTTPTTIHPGSMDTDTPNTNADVAQYARDLAQHARDLAQHARDHAHQTLDPTTGTTKPPQDHYRP